MEHAMANHTQFSNHEDNESKCVFSTEEIRPIMEVIAATGKFWHDWHMLKSVLSFWLRQVLADYPDAQMVSSDDPHQNPLSGETYAELVKRLDEALLSFVEGPPFTLQRLCEILLTPKSMYNRLSKFALALEKNLLVTSTLNVCTDQYSRPSQLDAKAPPALSLVDAKGGDGDEELVEAEADEDAPRAEPVEVALNADMVMKEEPVSRAFRGNSEINPDSDITIESCKANEQQICTTK